MENAANTKGTHLKEFKLINIYAIAAKHKYKAAAVNFLPNNPIIIYKTSLLQYI